MNFQPLSNRDRDLEDEIELDELLGGSTLLDFECDDNDIA